MIEYDLNRFWTVSWIQGDFKLIFFVFLLDGDEYSWILQHRPTDQLVNMVDDDSVSIMKLRLTW